MLTTKTKNKIGNKIHLYNFITFNFINNNKLLIWHGSNLISINYNYNLSQYSADDKVHFINRKVHDVL